MRVFIAIEFPESICADIEKSAMQLRRVCNGGGFARRENYHLTLAFLGEVAEEKISEVQEAMDQCTGGPIPITIGGLGRFRGREGDTLWRGIEAPETLYALQRQLAGELQKRGFVLEKRPFKPHLTIARRAVLAKGVDWAALSERQRTLNYTAEHITLFRSEQIRGKRVYTPLYEKTLA